MIQTFPSSPFQWIFLAPLILLCLSWVIDGSLWTTIQNYLRNTQASESNSVKIVVHPVSILLLTLNYLLSGSILFQVLYSSQSPTQTLIVLIILIGVPIYLIVSSFLIRLISIRSNYFSFYTSNVYFTITLFGILFYIASLVLFYFPQYKIVFLVILISLLILLNLSRVAISFLRAIEFKFSLFYIILYFCTLEILPFIVVISILNG